VGLLQGFGSEEHEAQFRIGRHEHNRGGAARRVCGAMTRGGAPCRQPPLSGHGRCLRHAGPKAARELRRRQIADLSAGRMRPEEFERHELRRAANRLRDQWKRDPWTQGQTLDLAEHEERFRTVSGLARLDTPVPPAVLDWLRWRYRRLQIDSRRDEVWAGVVFEEFPRRVRAAGPPPPTFDPSQLGASQSLWRAEVPPVGSRRNRADGPRVVAGGPVPVERASEEEHDPSALAIVAYEQRDVLAPLLELCGSALEQKAVVGALKTYLDRPGDPAAMRRWLDTVSALRSRA